MASRPCARVIRTEMKLKLTRARRDFLATPSRARQVYALPDDVWPYAKRATLRPQRVPTRPSGCTRRTDARQPADRPTRRGILRCSARLATRRAAAGSSASPRGSPMSSRELRVVLNRRGVAARAPRWRRPKGTHSARAHPQHSRRCPGIAASSRSPSPARRAVRPRAPGCTSGAVGPPPLVCACSACRARRSAGYGARRAGRRGAHGTARRWYRPSAAVRALATTADAVQQFEGDE